MPKKIKKENNLKKDKERFLNPDNIHYIFIVVAILVICVCVGAGIYVYKEDKYHSHKDNALVQFIYTEDTGEGYDVYSITETDTKQIFLEYNTIEVQDIKEISRGKYLDFNEEVYNSGIIDQMNDTESIVTDMKWNLYIKFADGTEKYLYSSPLGKPEEEISIDKTALAEIINKYFGQEIIYK